MKRCCEVQPLRHLRSRSMPPPLAGEALAVRTVFQQTQSSFIENETSLPRALPLGELARKRLRGQARGQIPLCLRYDDSNQKSSYRCVCLFLVTSLPSPSPTVTPLPKGEALADRKVFCKKRLHSCLTCGIIPLAVSGRHQIEDLPL